MSVEQAHPQTMEQKARGFAAYCRSSAFEQSDGPILASAFDAMAVEIEGLKQALRNCARNDRSSYSHHEPRPFDGTQPSPGSIWLTPREIARGALRERWLATPDDTGEG